MYTKFQFFCKSWNNENDQDMKMFKVNNGKKDLVSLSLALNIFHTLLFIYLLIYDIIYLFITLFKVGVQT